MKIKDVVRLIILGFLLRHIDTLIEMMITIIGNFQAESATKIQLRMNEMQENINSDESVGVIGFNVEEEIYEEEYE